MNEKEILKIRAFINDKDISEAVYGVLIKNFLNKRSGADVNVLASQILAVQMLQDAWNEMTRHKNSTNIIKDGVNPGI